MRYESWPECKFWELFNGNCDADLRIIGIDPELKGASGALKSIPTP